MRGPDLGDVRAQDGLVFFSTTQRNGPWRLDRHQAVVDFPVAGQNHIVGKRRVDRAARIENGFEQLEFCLAPDPRQVGADRPARLADVALRAVLVEAAAPAPGVPGPVSYTHLTLPTNREV